ncbi:tryptophanyl-tRNA synthetase [Xylariomycetidae sp. FL0641]|nr:tryptophanyl-tRNA synthetase [Xylariomycetidae sp. FL0641]
MLATVCPRCRPLVSATRQLRRAVQSRKSSSESQQKNAVIFSGIQPTGVPHLGNYLGAMRQWKRLQDNAREGDKLLFSIVDLHAITMPHDAEVLRTKKREMLAAMLAIGLDPKKSILFYQSSVPQHAELMWILSCTASMGYLGRMTQWKSKLQMHDKQNEIDDEATAARLKLGLFSYPVLQAADILVHRATHVPVGDDQRQHLEFARECVTNFHAHNQRGDVLVAPETITTPSPRIMSLQNPLNKMSKSARNPRSRIALTAEAREVRARVAGAVTDSENVVTWEPQRRPGVANLLQLLAQCGGGSSSSRKTPEQLAAEDFAGAGLGDLKRAVADAVVAELDGVRDRYHAFLSDTGGKRIADIEAEGAEMARKNAEETMREVRYAVGLSNTRL